jgi:hypothetical protein
MDESLPLPKREMILFSKSLHHPPVVEEFYDWALTSGYECWVTADIEQARARLLAVGGDRDCSVLFANCLFKEDVSELYGLLPECIPGVASGRLWLFALNALANDKVPILLRSVLPIEVVELPVSAHALRIKIESAFRECEEALGRPNEVRIVADRESDATASDDSSPGEQQRTSLKVDPVKARSLGLGEITLQGVTSGKDAFRRMEFVVEALRKNGARLEGPMRVHVCEITDSAVSLFMSPVDAAPGDRFSLRFSLATLQQGEEPVPSSSDCVMEWETLRKELDLPGGALFSGTFRDGDFLRFFRMRDQIEKRRAELEDFLRAARG